MRIHLKNYQAHKDTVIEVDSTLTSIIGSTDQGKSSIIRAIEFVRNNKPTGHAFIRKGSKEAKVSIDGVHHSKTKSANVYKVEGHEKPFKALRGAVPEEVDAQLNLGPDNVQIQHDSIFLLNKSAGKVAQKLSALVDLEPTIKALDFIASKKRNIKASVASIHTSTKVAEAALLNLEHIETLNTELTEIERKGTAIDNLQAKHDNLYNTIQKAREDTSALLRIPDTQMLAPMKTIIKQYQEIQEVQQKQSNLEQVMDQVVDNERLLSFDPAKLLSKFHRFQKLHDSYQDLSQNITKYTVQMARITKLRKKELTLKEQKALLLKNGCPLCGAINV